VISIIFTSYPLHPHSPITEEHHGGVRFVPLIGECGWSG